MKRLPLFMFIVILLIFSTIVLAQQAEFEIPRYRIAPGGAITNESASLDLSGAIGQAEAGLSTDGVRFVLAGGHWAGMGTGPTAHDLYLPFVVRSE